MYADEYGERGHGSSSVEPGRSLSTRESVFRPANTEAPRSWNSDMSRSSFFGGDTDGAGHRLRGPPPRLFTTGSLFSGPLPPSTSPRDVFERPTLPIAGSGSLFSGPPPSLCGPGSLFPPNNSTSIKSGDFLADANTNTIGAGGIFGSGGLENVISSTSYGLPQPTSTLPPLLPPLIRPRRSRFLPRPTASAHQQSSSSAPDLAITPDVPAIDALNTLDSPPSNGLFNVAERRHLPRRRTQQRKKSYEEVERERRTNLRNTLRPKACKPLNLPSTNPLDILVGPDSIVEVVVGSGSTAKTWMLHRALLTRHSSFFAAAFAPGRFAESSSNKIELSTDDPCAFGIFVQWLYTTECGAGAWGSFCGVSPLDTVKTYCLADKFGIPELRDATIHKLYSANLAKSSDILLTPSCIEYATQNSMPGCPLQMLMTDLCAQLIMNGGAKEDENGEWKALFNDDNHRVKEIMAQVEQTLIGLTCGVRKLTDYLEDASQGAAQKRGS